MKGGPIVPRTQLAGLEPTYGVPPQLDVGRKALAGLSSAHGKRKHRSKGRRRK